MRTDTKRKWCFVFILPPVWAMFSLLQYHFPGDEYGLYAASSIIGVWIYFLVPAGDVHNLLFPLWPALTGMAVMALAGLVLDWLKVNRVAFWSLWAGGVVWWFLTGVLPSPSPLLERVIARNDSLWAYLLAISNWGLYTTWLLMLAAAMLMKLGRRLSVRRKVQTSSNG